VTLNLQQSPPSNKQVDSWIQDLVGALTDPIIIYPSPWGDDIPQNLKEQIPLERLIMNMKVLHEGKGVPVGDLEALVYIFPRTMEAPMTDEQMHIYIHCFNKAMEFMHMEVPEDLKQKKWEELNNYEMGILDGLKRFIWDRRVKARKERARGETKAVSGETKTVNHETKELEIKTVQPSFF
jgi:hypothetical protein